MDGFCKVLAATLLGGVLLGPGAPTASGSELSKADRRWLDEVAPLMTPEEAGLFAEVDARDLERFRQIFWARRDPDPRTPQNELEEGFQAAGGELYRLAVPAAAPGASLHHQEPSGFEGFDHRAEVVCLRGKAPQLP